MPSPTITIKGITCSLYIDGFGDRAVVESSGPQGRQATMAIKCFWSDVPALRRALLGGVTIAGRVFTYVLPYQYPNDTSGLMVCTSIGDSFGLGYQTDPETGLGQYDFYVMSVNFSIPTYDTTDGTDLSHIKFVTTRIRTSTEVFAPPRGAFFFGGDVNRPVGVAGPGFIRPHAEISSTRHLVPYPFLQLAMSLQGNLNAQPMTFGDNTFARGQILFINADFEPTSDPSNGNRTFDIGLHMLGNNPPGGIAAIDWNFFINNDGNYELVRTAGVDGIPPYGYRDLSQLYGNSF